MLSDGQIREIRELVFETCLECLEECARDYECEVAELGDTLNNTDTDDFIDDTVDEIYSEALLGLCSDERVSKTAIRSIVIAQFALAIAKDSDRSAINLKVLPTQEVAFQALAKHCEPYFEDQ